MNISSVRTTVESIGYYAGGNATGTLASVTVRKGSREMDVNWLSVPTIAANVEFVKTTERANVHRNTREMIVRTPAAQTTVRATACVWMGYADVLPSFLRKTARWRYVLGCAMATEPARIPT